ncbi:MAG: type I glyceraldehyde-3-phosphate dehydrogenase [Firmicutes bacterium]|nr:type I glyceraldehyde-3-phosphate dehydrogenase [Bacillota bacterium]
MTVKVGINGFGRVAKSCLRASFQHPDVEVVAVNSVRDPKLLAHLLKYDSVYGVLDAEVEAQGQSLVVDGHRISILSERDPSYLNWGQTGAEIVLEATGAFKERSAAAAHLAGGAKKVIITSPGKEVDLTVVLGVNEGDYQPEKHHVISNASCTTNCLGVVVKALHERIGIKRASMTTIHSYTNDQRLLDITHKDFRRARAAGVSMIPTSTGAARNIGLVMPELEGKIDGLAIRVPTFTVSLVDLVAELATDVTEEDVNKAFLDAAQGEMKNYLGVSFEPLVSIDYKQCTYSGVVDALSTRVVGDKLVKVLTWYDNEWGYSQRVLDLAAFIAAQGL